MQKAKAGVKSISKEKVRAETKAEATARAAAVKISSIRILRPRSHRSSRDKVRLNKACPLTISSRTRLNLSIHKMILVETLLWPLAWRPTQIRSARKLIGHKVRGHTTHCANPMKASLARPTLKNRLLK